MDGVVASPLEAKRLRETFDRKFLIMTPGVRFSGGTQDDQRRIATPHEAIAAGADLLVMGRAILNAKDPAKAARDVIDILSAELS
jgi:orotidine-5'-phosphate decarboxylase